MGVLVASRTTGRDTTTTYEIDGRTYADVSSAADYLVITDDPCDVGLVERMLEFEPATHRGMVPRGLILSASPRPYQLSVMPISLPPHFRRGILQRRRRFCTAG